MKYIAVDFDGTCVEHEYPDVGRDVLGAVEWLREFVNGGAKIILWTMRNDSAEAGPVLSDAVKWFEKNNIPLFGVNENPTQHTWSKSPKAYAHIYIDDAAAGCPLIESKKAGARPMVDWSVIGPLVANRLLA